MAEIEEAAAVTPALIEKATNSTAHEVDPRLIAAIKSAARSSDLEVHATAETLMLLLKKQHSQVRYLSILIIDELFMRSKLFRSLIVPQFDQFLTLTVGFRRNLPLPPPSSIASMLRLKSIELLEKWNGSFGVHYRQIRLGFDYLKNTLRFQFPNRLETTSRVQQERREREIRSKQILVDKFENLKENYPAIKAEIGSTMDEIGECVDIVNVGAEMKDDTEDEGVEEEFKSLELRQIRAEAIKEGEKVRENSENKAVFDAIRELYKLLVTKHLVSVQEWISVLVRVDLSDNRFRDAALKEFIDLRRHIQSIKKRCEQLGCVLDDKPIYKEEEEEDFWEEGKVEIYVPQNSVDAPTSSTSKGKEKAKNVDSDAGCSSSTSLRSQLLSEAPVMTWSSSLDDWGSNRDALANQRGLELDGHWGRVDPDATIPAEKIAELKLHCMVYKEESSEIKPCLVPLKKGGFCQRRDLRVCPFHGPIVPRDSEGNPILETDTVVEVDSVDRESSLEKLAKQAVKNVREREREVNALKRAKREKVREHNEAVLREAAFASTSYSEAFGEHSEAPLHIGSGVRVKKETLTSMLKKKVTTKDRLEKRILNTRVRDASSRQVTQGEDLKYREAFPNQW